jgi:hypothetical protein
MDAKPHGKAPRADSRLAPGRLNQERAPENIESNVVDTVLYEPVCCAMATTPFR